MAESQYIEIRASEPRLWSLLGIMRHYKIADLVLMLSALDIARRDALHADLAGVNKEPSQNEWKKHLSTCLDGAFAMCSGIDLDTSLMAMIADLRDGLLRDGSDCRPAVLHTKLDSIIEGIHENLDRRMFMFVPKEDVSYWNNIELFGDDFVTVFPIEAVHELSELGKCFVASRPTACVFHCMRVAEHGLRILARRVNVKLTDKGKRIPIEYGTWDKVITAIRNKIADIRKLPIGPKKEKQLQFYAAATDHCDYMKDIWRNEISHSRHRFYTREETLGVISRVGLFVRSIAEHEIPKDTRKHLEKIQYRVQQLRQTYEENNRRSAQRNQGATGSGESGQNGEENKR